MASGTVYKYKVYDAIRVTPVDNHKCEQGFQISPANHHFKPCEADAAVTIAFYGSDLGFMLSDADCRTLGEYLIRMADTGPARRGESK